MRVERRGLVKYRGTDVALPVPWAAPEEMAAAFLELHHARYGFLMPGRGLTLEAVAVEAVGAGERAEAGRDRRARRRAPAVRRPHRRTAARPRRASSASVFTGGRRHEAPVYVREDLPPAAVVEGPAVICEPTSTTVVEPGWRAEVLAGGELLLRRTSPPARPSADPAHVSPLLLEVFNSLFMSIAEQMGATLANTAVLGEHQGAPRLQLRRVRRRGRPRRQRARTCPCTSGPWAPRCRRCSSGTAASSGPATPGCSTRPTPAGPTCRT